MRQVFLSVISLFPPWTRKCELIYQVDDDDFLYRVITPSVPHGGVVYSPSTSQGEHLLQDFILLASKRKPCGGGWVVPPAGWS